MSRKNGRVTLSARVDPEVLAYAREAARLSGLELSGWVERAVRQTMAQESADRAMAAVLAQGTGLTIFSMEDEDRCPHPGCFGVRDHLECPRCGGEHCQGNCV